MELEFFLNFSLIQHLTLVKTQKKVFHLIFFAYKDLRIYSFKLTFYGHFFIFILSLLHLHFQILVVLPYSLPKNVI